MIVGVEIVANEFGADEAIITVGDIKVRITPQGENHHENSVSVLTLDACVYQALSCGHWAVIDNRLNPQPCNICVMRSPHHDCTAELPCHGNYLCDYHARTWKPA